MIILQARTKETELFINGGSGEDHNQLAWYSEQPFKVREGVEAHLVQQLKFYLAEGYTLISTYNRGWVEE